MNMYDDYNKYIIENEELLTYLKDSNSSVMYCLTDVLEVLDYIYKKYIDEAKIDAELEEIFEIGFGYLSNCLIDINTYYKDYFKKDIILFNKYSTYIVYSIMLDDVKGYLLSEELMNEQREEELNNAAKLIEDTLINVSEISSSVIQKVEESIENVLPKKNTYRPVYAVFALIRDELGIF